MNETDAPEEWRPHPKYGDMVQASNLGRVRQFNFKTAEWKVCVVTRHGHGHLVFRTRAPLEKRWHKLRKFIAEAWLGPRPNGCAIRHVDGTQDCRPGNLEFRLIPPPRDSLSRKLDRERAEIARREREANMVAMLVNLVKDPNATLGTAAKTLGLTKDSASRWLKKLGLHVARCAKGPKKGTRRYGETCRRGHPFGSNVSRDGARRCSRCRNAAARKRSAARRSAGDVSP